jgi:cyclic-di-GMP-binding protein
MPSFDVVSEIDRHELVNAVDQANREVESRFDFRGTDAKFTLTEFLITLEAPSEFQVQQMRTILTDKLARRKIDVAAMAPEEPEVAIHRTRQKIIMKHGVDTEHAKKIVKLIKDSKAKVQASIQAEQVRVTGKKRDDLQEVIQMLKKSAIGLPLQYTNFRD